MRNNRYNKKWMIIYYYLALLPHVMKLCRPMQKKCSTDLRRTKILWIGPRIVWPVPRIDWQISSTLMGYWNNLTRQRYRKIHYLYFWQVQFHHWPINIKKMGQAIWGLIRKHFFPSCVSFYELFLKLHMYSW